MSYRVELKQLEHSFESGAKLFGPVDLAFTHTERVVIIGPSGQGKTTFLKILASLLKPARGQVFIDGENVYDSHQKARTRLRLKLGMLFQKNALFDSLRAGENIQFALDEASTLSGIEKVARVQSGLQSVGLAHAEQLFPDEMSGGMQKRLGIARAQALSPEILLYDDPTAGLDPITSKKIIELIKDLQQQRQNLIFVVTNEITRCFQLATRVLFIADGVLTDLGSPEQAKLSTHPRIAGFLAGEPEQ